MQLGLVPDPEATDNPEQLRVSQMTPEEREAKMKEIGLELPKKKLAEFNKQMDKMAQ